jgi:hypothetical protein
MKRVRHAMLVAMLLTTGSVSFAQGLGPMQAPAESEAMTDKARDLYMEGRTLYGQRAWDKAHAAFLAAWSLKKHWQIAGMLGHCEVQLGRHRDAAEHLAFAVRTGSPSANPSELEVLRDQLAEVKRKVGVVSVQVEGQQAEVLMDGRVVGTSPLHDPLFVDPGEYVLKARTTDRTSSEVKVTVAAGSVKEIMLRLDRGVEAEASPSPAASGASPKGEGDRAEGNVLYPVLFASAGALLGGGAVLGGVFWSKASGNADDVNELRDRLPSDGCANPAHASDCARLAEAQDDYDSNRSRRNIALVVGGVGLVGAGVTGYLWMQESKPEARALTVLPFSDGATAGVVAAGSF